MNSEVHSTARLLAVILCILNEDLRDELIKEQAVDAAGNIIPNRPWANLATLTGALEPNNLKTIQDRFSGESNINKKMIELRALTETAIDWVAGSPCPKSDTVNAMISGVIQSQPAT